MNTNELLDSCGPEWNRQPPATQDSIEALASDCSLDLPKQYLEFLTLSNGGEGELGVDPGWFQLWPVEEVLDLNRDYGIDEFLPGFFGFGSNGGGELLAFDTRDNSPWKVVMVPFIPMDVEEAIVIADDFPTFVQAIGNRHPDD